MDRGGNEPELARVRKRLRDQDGNPIGTESENPIVDGRIYEIEYEELNGGKRPQRDTKCYCSGKTEQVLGIN